MSNQRIRILIQIVPNLEMCLVTIPPPFFFRQTFLQMKFQSPKLILLSDKIPLQVIIKRIFFFLFSFFKFNSFERENFET